MIDHMNVVLNFHKGDQMSAKLLLELLLVVNEGIDCTYYLQYGDPTSTIEIRDTLTKFLNRKNARFSNELPNITVPQEMMSNDPNALKYEGKHTIRSTTFKMSMLGWNLCVFKYIYALDSFLMIEPDCCILKQNWLREIYEDYRNYSGPIFGHLKRGKIRGEYVPTHWAGCSIYNSEELRKLPLERYFYERYENPWWRYRNEKDTETADNCFWGPAFSGYDISYDYFLFSLYWKEKTGINDPFHWPINDIEDKQHFILCDFKTKLSADEIFDKFADRLPLMHGIKSDEIRHRMIKHFSTQGSAVRSLPLSGPEDSPIPQSNNAFLNIGELKERTSGSGVSSVERKSPIVSVIMPAFNTAKLIGKAVESVQAQSFTEWELIVIDDGSSDNTREIVQDLITRDSRIRLVKDAGKGVSDARNTGLDAARGDFITFLDADDFMYPDALKRRVDALRNNPGWHLVHCVTEAVDANSRKLRWQLGGQKEVSFKDMRYNVCHINSLLGRAQVFKSVRFQAGLTNGEDWLFFSDILRTGEASHRVDKCSVAYVIRRDSAVCRDYLSHENKLLEVMDIIYSPVRNNLPAAPEFAQGLSSPPKEAVLLRRRIGLLTWLLLEQRASDVAAVLSEFSAQALSALSRSEIRHQIVTPAMRFYVCRQEELPKRLHKDKARILRLISETGIEKTFPHYAHEFKSLMRKAPTLRNRGLYQRLVGYLNIHYPVIITIGRFGKWSLTTLKNTFFGIGGISLLVIAGLYIAGALIEPLRWYLVGIATALLLLGGGVLAVSYAKLWLNRFVSSQRPAMKATPSSINRDVSVLTNKELEELGKRAQWRTIKNLYRGQRAFIIGNGPSLNRTPLHLLKNEFTLCFNRFDLMFERLGWRPTMYMCIDDRVAESTASQINEIIPLVKLALFPDIHPCGLDFRQFIEDAHNVFWLSLKSVHDPTGSYETLPTCSTRGTVAHLGLQVLAFMGFSPIYLLGVDMDYKEHKTVENRDQQKWTATRDDDPNHFDPRYFGAGAKYYRPSPFEFLTCGFDHAKEPLDRKGIRVLNAGIGGLLETFPRVDFRSLFDLGEDAEVEMLLSAVPSELQPLARDALRADRVIEVKDDWDERSPLQVTTLLLAEQLIPKVIFTHIPYGPFGNRYLFIRREKTV